MDGQSQQAVTIGYSMMMHDVTTGRYYICILYLAAFF